MDKPHPKEKETPKSEAQRQDRTESRAGNWHCTTNLLGITGCEGSAMAFPVSGA